MRLFEKIQDIKKMIYKFKLIHLATVLCFTFQAQAQVDPGVDFDLNTYINQKLDEGETNVVVPPGRYRVPEVDNHHLFFNERNDVTIIADGVEMICTETVHAVRIRKCNNFKIQGLTIDYDPLPFTQGEIVEMSEDKRTLTIDLYEGYPTTVIGSRVEIYDKVTEELTTSTYYNISYTVDETTRRVVLTKPSNYSAQSSKEEVGDIVVLDSRNNKNIPHAIRPETCTGLVLEDITLHAGTSFGFFETNCSGSQYINCKVDRRPLETDIKQRAVKRMRSNNLDGFHSKHAEVGPSYIGCVARYQGDDGIAINGDYHLVMATDENKLRVVGKEGRATNIAVGDSVELVSYKGNRLPNAKVLAIELGPAPTAVEKAFLRDQTFYGSLSNTYLASNIYYITLDRPIYLPTGSLIASTNRIGNGFEVRDCIMGPNRSRGILVKASNGTISGNTLKDNWGQAIKLAPEYGWLEAGSSSNVTITDNVISGCHDAAIAVYANAGNGAIAPTGAHDNIQILNNTISGSTNPAIAVTSTSNLVVEGNTIQSPNNDLLLPWLTGSFGRSADPNREIYINNYDLISVDGVSINNCIDTLQLEETFDLNRTISPGNAAEQTTRWVSSDTSIATVDDRGLIKTLSSGTVTFTVTTNDGNFTDECTIHIPEPMVLSLDKKRQESKGFIYPNPSDSVVNFEGFRIGEKIQIYTISGNLLCSFVFKKRNSIELPKGLYFIKAAGKGHKLIVY